MSAWQTNYGSSARKSAAAASSPAAEDLITLPGKTDVLVAGIRVATQTPPMRSGKRVVFISVDDGTGCADATFFEEAQNNTGPLLFGTRLLVIQGRTRRTGACGVSVEAERAWDMQELMAAWSQRARDHNSELVNLPRLSADSFH